MVLECLTLFSFNNVYCKITVYFRHPHSNCYMYHQSYVLYDFPFTNQALQSLITKPAVAMLHCYECEILHHSCIEQSVAKHQAHGIDRFCSSRYL